MVAWFRLCCAKWCVCFRPPNGSLKLSWTESPVVSGLLQRPAAVPGHEQEVRIKLHACVQCLAQPSPAQPSLIVITQVLTNPQFFPVASVVWRGSSSSLGCRIISVVTQQRSKSANPPTHAAAAPHNYTVRAIGELSYFILLDPFKR